MGSIILILIICGCDPLSLQNDLLEYNLEGSVKSIRERAFRAKNENGEIIIGEQYNPIYKGENHNFYMKFNENGFLAKKIAFDENDMEKGTIIYKYDKDDKLIKEESFNAT